jgi:hypothetical protein
MEEAWEFDTGKGMEGRAAGVGGAIDEVVCLLGPLVARYLTSC